MRGEDQIPPDKEHFSPEVSRFDIYKLQVKVREPPHRPQRKVCELCPAFTLVQGPTCGYSAAGFWPSPKESV